MENVENAAGAENTESVGSTGSTENPEKPATVAIISVGKGVIVNGIERKLKESDIGTICVEASVDAVQKIQKDILLFVLYVSESVDEVSGCLKHLRDLVDDTGKGVVVVGPKLEWEELWKKEPGLDIVAWYDKLLDMEGFAEYIKKYLEGYAAGKMKKRILVVDDDSDYAKTVREWMNKKYRISVVSSGAEAIEFLKKEQVDLVLLDYDMPETNGAEVLRMIREDSNTKRVPVILLTEVDDKQGVASVLGLDLQGYILKDTEKEKVLVRITKFFHTQNMITFK